MSVNRNRPHVLVLPEDDANLAMATGFVLEFATRQIQRLPVAGGWREVFRRFEADHINAMHTYPERLMVLLVDFDGEDRLVEAFTVIPKDLKDRVFVLGAWTEPEDLRRTGVGSFETIGRAMARDCHRNTNQIWGHKLLRHNAGEVARFCERARPVLFPS